MITTYEDHCSTGVLYLYTKIHINRNFSAHTDRLANAPRCVNVGVYNEETSAYTLRKVSMHNLWIGMATLTAKAKL